MTVLPQPHTPRGRRSLPGPDDTLRTVLDNGITVLVRENLASPAVVVQGYLESGSQDEPAGMHGLAGFATDVMERGTVGRSFSELYEAVESIGAGFGLAIGTHTASFAAKGLAEDADALLSILADVLRRPAFDPDQIERARTEILTDIRERAQETRRMAGMTFYELAYPEEHPYHWSQLGYTETIEPITRDDLAAFHRTTFSPGDLVIVIVGGIRAGEAVRSVTRAFGDWNGCRATRSPLFDVPTLECPHIRRVSLDEKAQANVVMGWPGPSRHHCDFVPCLVGNTILGLFGMYGRLGQSIREENGLAYYVFSKLSGGTGPGPWRVTGGFDPGHVDRGVELIRSELRRFIDAPVTEDELANTASYMTGSLPLHLETNEGVARSLISIERYGLGLDYLQNYTAMIQEVTSAKILAAARRWIDPDNYALAIAEPTRETG